MKQAMMIETRRAPACAVALFPLRCKGGKHRPRHQVKVTILVQQDQDQQSGRMEVIVERKNKTLVEMARTMLDEYKTHPRFWPEAIDNACHIINRVLKEICPRGNNKVIIYFLIL